MGAGFGGRSARHELNMQISANQSGVVSPALGERSS